MRNSKVRARIAAGKLRLRIRDLRNLGTKSEEMLSAIGVYSADELRRRGAVQAFCQLKRAGITSSLNTLWALAGALEPWRRCAPVVAAVPGGLRAAGAQE
jgi:hypothetical protein